MQARSQNSKGISLFPTNFHPFYSYCLSMNLHSLLLLAFATGTSTAKLCAPDASTTTSSTTSTATSTATSCPDIDSACYETFSIQCDTAFDGPVSVASTSGLLGCLNACKLDVNYAAFTWTDEECFLRRMRRRNRFKISVIALGLKVRVRRK